MPCVRLAIAIFTLFEHWLLCVHGLPYEIPFVQTALAVLRSEGVSQCLQKPKFETCANPWIAVESWRYAVANLRMAFAHEAGRISFKEADLDKADRALALFFNEPTEKTLRRAGVSVSRLCGVQAKSLQAITMRQVIEIPSHGLGVPFPVSSVVLARDHSKAFVQLKNGAGKMPLLGLATRQSRPPSISAVVAALELGVRHLDVAVSTAAAVGEAIQRSGVQRIKLFLAITWDENLDADPLRFESVLVSLRTNYVDLIQHGPGLGPSAWKRLAGLQSIGKVRALGTKNLPLSEVEALDVQGNEAADGAFVAVAQSNFSPYRPGSPRTYWQTLGQKSVALVASGLFTDWPHGFQPLFDPHVQGVSKLVGRSPAQVLLRWALQLGLAVVFRSGERQHVAENLAVFDFELRDSEMRLLSGLTTLALPNLPPGDGFAYTYYNKHNHGRRKEL